MDPLSQLLSLLRPQSYISSGFHAGGKWSVQFGDQSQLIKCYAVVSGACWLQVDGIAEPLALEQGDSFVLPSGQPFRLASDLDLPSVAASDIFPTARRGGEVFINGGGDLFMVGSRFGVSGGHAGMLLAMLPPVVHLRKASDQAALRWSVERMMQELREGEPGGYLIAQHLAHMMLVQALRAHLAEGPGDGVGWFFALADRQLAKAIAAIHADPARRWTLQELGEVAGMSRSTFALRFKETAGETPMDYLSRWRMLLACDRLETSGDPVSAIAPAIGYESESAFSTAFKRVMGCSPRQYGRMPRPGATRSDAEAARQPPANSTGAATRTAPAGQGTHRTSDRGIRRSTSS